nr:MAG TPA: hypothetical protein [Caudoviricetes sp.]
MNEINKNQLSLLIKFKIKLILVRYVKSKQKFDLHHTKGDQNSRRKRFCEQLIDFHSVF